MIASVARRYARALLALGVEEEREEKFGDQLASVIEAMNVSKVAGAFLRNPGYTPAQRHAAVDVLAEALKLSPTVARFLSLLVDRQRIVDLAQIARVYGGLLDAHAGRVRATVTTAAELSDRDLKKVRDALEDMTGRTIVLDAKTDPTILGGAVTQVGATRLDGSLKTQLDRMRDELKAAPIL